MSITVIVALDFDDQLAALRLVEQLDPKLCALKVGSQMFTLFGREFIRILIRKQFHVFLDLKFHDIPNTVAQVCMAAADIGVWMLTLHASGGQAMMQAARDAVASYGTNRPLLVGVTALTSMHDNDLAQLGIDTSLQAYASRLACLAQASGLDGVVCSALDVLTIKSQCGHDFLTVTPGIRREIDASHDQVRITTPKEAYLNGSDFIVVGRPIISAKNPALTLIDFFKQ
jgi:orotidine-5'-phosphate decarboxylase